MTTWRKFTNLDESTVHSTTVEIHLGAKDEALVPVSFIERLLVEAGYTPDA